MINLDQRLAGELDRIAAGELAVADRLVEAATLGGIAVSESKAEQVAPAQFPVAETAPARLRVDLGVNAVGANIEMARPPHPLDGRIFLRRRGRTGDNTGATGIPEAAYTGRRITSEEVKYRRERGTL